MMFALAIHCTIDGVALAAGGNESSPSARQWLDASLTMAICVHKAPEGLALGALLLGRGLPSRADALAGRRRGRIDHDPEARCSARLRSAMRRDFGWTPVRWPTPAADSSFPSRLHAVLGENHETREENRAHQFYRGFLRDCVADPWISAESLLSGRIL